MADLFEMSLIICLNKILICGRLAEMLASILSHKMEKLPMSLRWNLDIFLLKLLGGIVKMESSQ